MNAGRFPTVIFVDTIDGIRTPIEMPIYHEVLDIMNLKDGQHVPIYTGIAACLCCCLVYIDGMGDIIPGVLETPTPVATYQLAMARAKYRNAHLDAIMLGDVFSHVFGGT